MDPFSIAVGVVGVVTAIDVLRKAVRKLAKMRHAPEGLIALNNEISDLHVILIRIRSIPTEQSADATHGSICDDLWHNIQQANHFVFRLQSIVDRSLTKQDRHKMDSVRRFVWMRAQSEVETIRKELRKCRMNMADLLAVMTMFACFPTSLTFV